MVCAKGRGTRGIDNISLMQGCRSRRRVMDLPALTDDGYCGLKVATKEGKKRQQAESFGGLLQIRLIGADSANCGFNSRGLHIL